MKCCNSNPFVPQPHNVIWLCEGQEIPDGWIETSRFDFGCVSAVSLWPAGMDMPGFDGAVVRASGGVVSSFSRGGIDYTQVLFNASGYIEVYHKPITSIRSALGAGGGSNRVGFNRGGGGGGEVRVDSSQISPLDVGVYDVSIGAGGAPGAAGSDSIITKDGVAVLTVKAGGRGGNGSAAGEVGGNGGGAGGNLGSRLGGVGVQYNGGRSGGLDTTPGGGGGASGVGLPGGDTAGVGGAGGPGVDILWTEADLSVGGGGGGAGISTPGGASHGGTSGTTSGRPNDATWSGGAGGGRGSNIQEVAAGGDGFFVIVFPSEGVLVL